MELILILPGEGGSIRPIPDTPAWRGVAYTTASHTEASVDGRAAAFEGGILCLECCHFLTEVLDNPFHRGEEDDWLIFDLLDTHREGESGHAFVHLSVWCDMM
jgi:hypothetical protein